MSESGGNRIFNLLRGKFSWMILLLLMGVVLLTLGNFLSHGKKEITENKEKPSNNEVIEEVVSDTSLPSIEGALEKRLEGILQQIEGVGKVSVTMILGAGPEYRYATNMSSNERETKETDSGGGERITIETTGDHQLVLTQAAMAGVQEPVVQREIKPVIEGVLVVAEGAKNPIIKAELTRTVQTLLGIRANTVTVRPMQN